MKYILNIIYLLPLLTGCSLLKPPPVQPVEVNIPIPVSCMPPSVPEPGWNIPRLQPMAAEEVKLKAELADLELARGYIGELEAELKGCE
jgi:hypothetical protein